MASADLWRNGSFEDSSEDSPREQIRPRNPYFYRLESECSVSNESDTESIHSVQDKVTDCAKDTSDTETTTEEYHDPGDVEYELASLHTDNENDSCYMFYKSSSEENAALYVAAIVGDSEPGHSDSAITGSEDSDSYSIDTSYEPINFGICLQCKSKHNNPQFRFCETCYQDRKSFFPPRPKGFRKARPKKKSSPPVKLKTRSGPSGLRYTAVANQDSGTGSQDWAQSSGSSLQVSGLGPQQSGICSQESATNLSGTPSCSQLSSLLPQESETSGQEPLTSSQEFVASSQGDLKSEPPFDDDQRPSTSKGLDSNRKRTLSESSISDGEEMPQSKKAATTRLVEMLRKDAEAERSLEDGNEETGMPELEQKCVICNIKPKNSIFLHGSIAHMCSCYRCAMKTWKFTKKCPICKRGISNVVKVFTT